MSDETRAKLHALVMRFDSPSYFLGVTVGIVGMIFGHFVAGW